MLPRKTEDNLPGISVLMPVHNASKTVRQAIISTLNALGTNDELIVIDDGSTDASYKVSTDILDPRLRVEKIHKNQGISSALNLGLKLSTHSLIARMDADDICLPWRFKFQRPRMVNQKLDLLFNSAILQYSRPAFSYIPQLVKLYSNESQPSVGELLLVRNCLMHPTMLARKAVLQDAGGWPIGFREDYRLWMKLLSNEDIRVERNPIPAIVFRVLKSSESRREAQLQSPPIENVEKLLLLDSINRSTNKELDLGTRQEEVLAVCRKDPRSIFDLGVALWLG